MYIFSPPPQKEPDADHALNVWLSLACVILAVAAAIAWRTWNNPSLNAMRIASLAEHKLAAIAAGPRPVDAETINQKEMRQ